MADSRDVRQVLGFAAASLGDRVVPLKTLDDDPEDDLDEAERRARDESIREGLQDGKEGRTRPAEEILEELRRARRT